MKLITGGLLLCVALAGCGGGDTSTAPALTTTPPAALDASANLACSRASDAVAAARDTATTDEQKIAEVDRLITGIKSDLSNTTNPEVAATSAAFNSNDGFIEPLKALLTACGNSDLAATLS